MAELSNQLVVVAIFGYLVAMLGFLSEYVFGTRGVVARAVRPVDVVRERELVGAAVSGSAVSGSGGGGMVTGGDAVADDRRAGPAAPGEPRDRTVLFGRVALAATGFGVLAHVGILVTRGLAAGRVPWGNMYEFVVALSLVGAVAWLALVLKRPSLRVLGLFVTLALVLVLGFAGMVLYTKVAPLVPALNSYWLKIHVTAAASASGLFLVAFVPAALYLVRAGYEAGRRRFPYSIGNRLPAAETLERLSFRLHAFAFPVWTFAVICGAIWAESAWGRYWGWDPKETWSFISWVAYAAYLHARATPSVKRTRATWLAVAAWGTMMINLYVINFVAVGLHSYAGVH
jgi:cytochrome c-type biogenesis protein CcsB